ncbi:MAG TPA: hypothetical protein PKE56_17330, partial [Acidimicrobiales bacterium]|nr:hypothetical protein [Acidimicrobiales bacterium]
MPVTDTPAFVRFFKIGANNQSTLVGSGPIPWAPLGIKGTEATKEAAGIVLATAGLSRLYADTSTEREGRKLLDSLLAGLNIMVLPLTDSPGAPGQGARAIECRANDDDTR